MRSARISNVFTINHHLSAVIGDAVRALENAGAIVEEVKLGIHRSSEELGNLHNRSMMPLYCRPPSVHKDSYNGSTSRSDTPGAGEVSAREISPKESCKIILQITILLSLCELFGIEVCAIFGIMARSLIERHWTNSHRCRNPHVRLHLSAFESFSPTWSVIGR